MAQGYQPPPGYELKKKRKKWPWVLGALVLLIVIIVAASSGGGEGETAPAADPNNPAPAEGITYEVTTTGQGTALVTYTSDQNFNQAQENGVPLPWTKTVDMGDSFFSAASLVAQAGQGVDSITCRIRDGDRVLSENTSTGQFAVVTCSGR